MKHLAFLLIICSGLKAYSQTSEETDKISAFYIKQKTFCEKFLGKQFPDFTLEMPDSQTFTNKDFSNKVVFINFWAEFCSPCIAETEGLKQLYSKLNKYPDFLFVSFSCDPDSTIHRLIKKYGINFKVYHLDKNEYSRLNFNNGIPTSIILNRNGIIKFFITGGTDEKDLATKYVMIIIYPQALQLIVNK
jgi:cytochrome oxidase Cu insertion factor (SCO1/SenC/PrrC family)